MRCVLFLDFDGTLAPIAESPGRVRFSRRMRDAVAAVSERRDIVVAIISGRKLSELKKFFRGMHRLIYSGNHGLELEMRGRKWILPQAKRFMPVLKKIRDEIRGAVRTRGFLLEDKELTLSLHYRLVAKRSVGEVKRAVASVLSAWRGKVRVTGGKKVIEVRPPFDWHKGKIVMMILKKLGLRSFFPVYLGDDRTDEDAFLALRGAGLGISVGPRKRRYAAFNLKEVNEVRRFLLTLAKACD